MTKKVPLTGLSRELAILTGRPAPTYRRLWNAIANGEIPADKGDNGRYVCDPHAVAEALGLTVRVAA